MPEAKRSKPDRVVPTTDDFFSSRETLHADWTPSYLPVLIASLYRRASIWLSLLVLPLAATASVAGQAKCVLVVNSFGSFTPPFTTTSTAFETELTKRLGEGVDLDEVSLDMARYADPEMQQAMVEYIQKRLTKWHPDLVVPIGSPAGIFVAQHRDVLFSNAPVLYCGMDRRRMPPDALKTNAAFVGESLAIPGFIEDILAVAPDTTNIVVVAGASPIEQYWKTTFSREFRPFKNRLKITWLSDLSFDQMLTKVRNLPRHSFIFVMLMLRDAAGVTHDEDEVITRIHEVANAPVNGIFMNQLGLGIVGGRLYQPDLTGAETARAAIRILHGEAAESLPPKIIEPAAPHYDSRELQRWRISEAKLPPGSVVEFRDQTNWKRYGNWIVAGALVCIAQAAFISMLLASLAKRRRAQRELRESEERMKLAATAADLGIWEWDMVNDKIWSPIATPARLRSGHAGPWNYDGYLESVHPDDREDFSHALAKSMNGDGDYESVHRTILADGETRWIASRGRIGFDENRKPIRMRGIAQDITARKQAEDVATESKKEFLLIANAAPVLIWVSGPDKLCTFFNQPWLDFRGRMLDEEQGNGWAEGVHPDDLSACIKTYEESFDARRPFTMEYRLRRYDGEYRWMLDSGAPYYGVRGDFLGYIGSCMDVTERKEAEADARRTHQELAHATRVATMGVLAGSLAHELNQPLAAILTNAHAAQHLLSGDAMNLGEVREILRDIIDEDRRASEVVVRMRAMLKREEARLVAQDLNEIVSEVLGIMRGELMARKTMVITRLAPGLKQIKGDRIQLQQVLLNLLVNACDAMTGIRVPDRQVTLETRAIATGQVQVSVSDRGPGFSPELLERDFEAFRTTKPNGLGLGLPICRAIINSHGGRLWATNNGERGATVHVTLEASNGEAASTR